MMWCKTMCSRLRRAVRSVTEYCPRHRHDPAKAQHAALTRRVLGHFNYYGVNGNIRSLARLIVMIRPIWLKWLRRRSQKSRLTWERYQVLLERFPFPTTLLQVRPQQGVFDVIPRLMRSLPFKAQYR